MLSWESKRDSWKWWNKRYFLRLSSSVSASPSLRSSSYPLIHSYVWSIFLYIFSKSTDCMTFDIFGFMSAWEPRSTSSGAKYYALYCKYIISGNSDIVLFFMRLLSLWNYFCDTLSYSCLRNWKIYSNV